MRAILKISEVSKQFGGVRAVDGVSFQVNEGQIVAIIGPNGAGKTTLFNIIAGVLRPNQGSVSFSDHDISRLNPQQIAKAGLVRTFQLVRLFTEMTVLENLIVGFHLRTSAGLWAAMLRSRRACDEMREVEHKARGLLDLVGLLSQAGVVAKNVTYGQQRLLEVARALASQPRLLMLDEPAAGLNHAETKEFTKLIQRIRGEGTTVLFIEHDMNMVMSTAETVIVLDFGRKIAEGAPERVRSDPTVQEAYLGSI